MRILIVSNMNASQPYGAWTRPYYLGEALSQSEQIFQLGFDTSDVVYGQRWSTNTKSIPVYIRAIHNVLSTFNPDVIYCHETFPAVAAYLAINLTDKSLVKPPCLVFDMHSLHAVEYKAMLDYFNSRARGLYMFAKAYYSQRFIVKRKRHIIAASSELKTLLIDWYGVEKDLVTVIPNGAPPKFLTTSPLPTSPYPLGFKHALLVAPKNMVANELAVNFTLQIANRILESPTSSHVRIVVIGGGWRKEQIEKYQNLIYLGHVKDYLTYIDHSDICLLPYPNEAVCGGARNKALDYFARKKIVLSTIEGMRGLSEFKPGKHAYYSTYDPDKFADDLVEIITHLPNYRYLGENARQLVETEYNWQRSAESVLSTIKRIM